MEHEVSVIFIYCTQPQPAAVLWTVFLPPRISSLRITAAYYNTEAGQKYPKNIFLNVLAFRKFTFWLPSFWFAVLSIEKDNRSLVDIWISKNKCIFLCNGQISIEILHKYSIKVWVKITLTLEIAHGNEFHVKKFILWSLLWKLHQIKKSSKVHLKYWFSLETIILKFYDLCESHI